MTFDFNVNLTSLTSIIVAGIAILTYLRGVRASVQLVRDNDLKHIDAKLDALGKRIDDVYRLIAEGKK